MPIRCPSAVPLVSRPTAVVAVLAVVAAITGPAATPAVAATAATGCVPTMSGARPSAANTGPRAGVRLTRHDGDIVVTRAGTVLSGLDVHGFVRVEAANVTVRDSVVRGRYLAPHDTAVGQTGLIDNYGGPGLRIEHVRLLPAYPSVFVDGVHAYSPTTVTAVEISGVVDGVDIGADAGGTHDVVVQNSYVHDEIRYAHDPYERGGPSHNDGIQDFGGDHHVIRGNTFEHEPAQGSVIQTLQQTADTTDLVITDNWIDGGNYSINISNSGRSVAYGIPGPVTITHNLFGLHQTANRPPPTGTGPHTGAVIRLATLFRPASRFVLTDDCWTDRVVVRPKAG